MFTYFSADPSLVYWPIPKSLDTSVVSDPEKGEFYHHFRVAAPHGSVVCVLFRGTRNPFRMSWLYEAKGGGHLIRPMSGQVFFFLANLYNTVYIPSPQALGYTTICLLVGPYCSLTVAMRQGQASDTSGRAARSQIDFYASRHTLDAF